MELLILDKNFEEIATIELFSSLQWNRKYYDYGDFELETDISHVKLFQEGVYLFRKDYELALIEEITYERSDSNEYSLKVSGRFITAILDDRVVVGEKKLTGNHEDIAYQLLNENFIQPTDALRKVNYLSVASKSKLGESTTLELKNAVIGKKLNEFLEEKELAHKIEYDYLNNQLVYSVWKGLNRTEEQTINSWAVFSDDYDNIVNIDYSHDMSDYINFAYVVGKDNLRVEVNQIKEGERRREKVVSSSDSDRNVLADKGKQELDKNKLVEVIDCNILSSENLLYRRDYDLGDLCTVKIRSIDKMSSLRITEVKEVYENGEIRIEPKFGDDYITITKFIEREVKS